LNYYKCKIQINLYTYYVFQVESCGIDHMLKNDQYDKLKHLYNILGFVNGGLKVMFDCTRPYFSKLGTSIVLTNIKISNAFTCIEVIYLYQIPNK